MSTENIQLFFAKAKADSELRGKIAEISRQETQSGIEALSQLSEQAGTPFTAAEFASSIPQKGELSDAELERVAGGAGQSRHEEHWAADVAAMIGYHSGARA